MTAGDRPTAAPSLGQLQRWLSAVIRHPRDAATAALEDAARALIPRGPVLAGEIVKPSSTQQPLQRLDVYNGGYLARLLEVLETDYEGLQYALGYEAWRRLGAAYVDAHPSRHPNLNGFGGQLPAFVAAQRDLRHRSFLADLARLEWTVVEAFNAPEFTPLDMRTLSHLTEAQWARTVLHVNPSLRVVKFDWPVLKYLQDVYDDKKPRMPKKAEPVCGAVYRKADRVWRVRLPMPMAAILGALAAGRPFATALEAGGEHQLDLTKWFQEWSADGLFVKAETKPSEFGVE